MTPIDPIRQPQHFIQHMDAMIRQSLAEPGGPDPFQVIDQQLEASFEAVLHRVSGHPEPTPARPSSPAPPDGEAPRHAPRAATPYAGAMPGMIPGMMPGMVPGMMPGMAPGMMPGMAPGMMPGMMPGMVPGMMPGMRPGMLPGMMPDADGEQGAMPMIMPMMVPMIPPAPVRKPDATSGPALGGEISSIVGEMSARYQVPEWLVKNVIRAESGGDPLATSPVGAMGLMQLMPGTALDMGVRDPYNARDNIEGGVKYLRRMLDMFNGDVTKAVAAYNAGPGNVQQHGGVPPFAETQAYVRRVLG